MKWILIPLFSFYFTLVSHAAAPPTSSPHKTGSAAQEDGPSKAEVQKELEEGFESLKAQVKELQAKARHATGEVKKDLDLQIENLKKDQQELQSRLHKLKNTSGNAWQDMKSGASEAYERFKASVRKAKARFDEKSEDIKETK